MLVEKFIHVEFDESNTNFSRKDNDLDEGVGLEKLSLEGGDAKPKDEPQDIVAPIQSSQDGGDQFDLPKEWKYKKSHLPEQIMGDPSQGVRIRASFRNEVTHSAFISQIEPISFEEAEKYEFWILAMQEELEQFNRNDVWELVSRPKNHSIIDTK
ncbi:hypothetical protein AXF42_Ash006913 [Apostasia shenzhenica]|uniref:Retrovirus-related Pol polyprotein from transposon TNT 1-94 n=1 Tax=Apostasia shenzhenica TaxID=1088818 RepID=A0A2I0BEN3_9ASPA|nr:hypothetical protein AXF42_Ash006913 [Apostasia shenzhenica]